MNIGSVVDVEQVVKNIENLPDVAFASHTMFTCSDTSLSNIKDMIRQVKAYQILEGARGGARADVEGIQQCMIRLGQLVSDFPCIAELDINPLIVGPPPAGCAVADVRIRLERGNGQG